MLWRVITEVSLTFCSKNIDLIDFKMTYKLKFAINP